MPPFLLALAVSLAATPLVRFVALRRGFVARPTGDRWHRRPTALLGGIAVFVATVPAALAGGWLPAPFPAIAAGAALVFLVGLADDVLSLRPVTKLAWQIAAASLAVWGGASLGWTESLTLDALLTIFWLIGVTNAFNLIDNMDGACAGVGTIAAASVAAIALVAPGGPVAGGTWAAGLAGALAGFLVYNFHPAKIFLGDSGSLFIGFLLAALTSAVAGARPSRLSLVALPVLVLAVPIFDTTLVTVARRLSGRRASVGGTDHTAHRLVRLGFSETRAVVVLYVLTSVAGAAAVALAWDSAAWELLAGVLVLTLGLLGLVLLGVRVYGGQDYSVILGGPVRLQLAGFLLRHHVFEVLLDLALVAAAYYVSYRLRFERERWPVFFPTFLRSLPVVIASQVLALLVTGAYGRIWRYFSLTDFVPLAKGVALGSAASILLLVYLYRFEDVSRGVLLINAVLLTLLLAASRMIFRAVPEIAGNGAGPGDRRTVIYGAGDGGEMLVREIGNNRQYGYRPVAFVDDDPRKVGRRVHGIPVVGGMAALRDILNGGGADAVIVSSRLFPQETLTRVSAMGQAAGVPVLRFHCGIEALPVVPEISRSRTELM